MLREQAITDAKREARESGLTMAVVYAPIENTDEEGDYGYCPTPAVDILFTHGHPVYHVTFAGEVIDVEDRFDALRRMTEEHHTGLRSLDSTC